ncbi:Hypothetical protein PBC10988_23070 [Planctomycetales bacterium 10988]|nr:Hypothetical protein PBC10988_23070 [Planctomycetales bacterium 10988]
MASPSVINGDQQFNGRAIFNNSVTLPEGGVKDREVAAAADIEYTKVQHVHAIGYQQDPGSAVVAETKLLHIARGSKVELIGLKAVVITPATGADRTVTIDLQRSTGGGAFASVLTAELVFDDGATARTPVTAAIDSATLAENDLLQLVITVAGSADDQAEGLLVTLHLYERAT